jgi:hypothetical protein
LIHGDASGDPAALAVGAADEVLTHDGTDFDWAAASGGASLRPNAKPLVINGNMAVAQRSTSISVSSAGYHTVDRIRYSEGGDVVVTMSQETLTADEAYEDGFHNALKLDCTTADASVAAGDFAILQYKLEAQDCLVFKRGTPNAQKITVSFWFKATVTGTYILMLDDGAGNRKICEAYTVSSADTWEKKIIVLENETSNPMADTNVAGFALTWWLMAGSTYAGGTLATSWEATTWDSNAATGQVNAFDSDSNNVHITGIQMEVGEYTSATLPPFQHESYGDNLIRCQRYLQRPTTSTGTAISTSAIQWVNEFHPQMRATPTTTMTSIYISDCAYAAHTDTTVASSASGLSPSGGYWTCENIGTSLTKGRRYQMIPRPGVVPDQSWQLFDAEL